MFLAYDVLAIGLYERLGYETVDDRRVPDRQRGPLVPEASRTHDCWDRHHRGSPDPVLGP